MKSSLKFREERCPLLRAKVPFQLGPLTLSSAISLGNKQDLALQLATGFSCGPVIKLSFKPHDPSPLAVILKSGLGLWGSPKGAPFTVAAEVSLAPKVSERLISVQIKPRFGDFGIRKGVTKASSPSQEQELSEAVRLRLQDNGNQNQTSTDQRGENGSLFGSLPNKDSKAAIKQMNGNFLDKESTHRSSMDSSNMTIGSDLSLRFQGMENGHDNQKQRVEVLQGEGGQTEMPAFDKNMIAHVPHERPQEHWQKAGSKPSASFSLAGVRDALRDCKLVVHSSLPLGSQSLLNIRWGIKTASSPFQVWDGTLPTFSFEKLPSLILEKVSFEQVVVSPTEKVSELGITGSFEQALLPVNFVKENRELAQVASLCYTMKRQLHLMHAENLVLKRAMEDMKFHVDTKNSSWTLSGPVDDTRKDSSPSTKLPHKSSILDTPPSSWLGSESSNHHVHSPKGKRVMPKTGDLHSKWNSVSVNDSKDVSKELEKAILDVQSGSSGGKKD